MLSLRDRSNPYLNTSCVSQKKRDWMSHPKQWMMKSFKSVSCWGFPIGLPFVWMEARCAVNWYMDVEGYWRVKASCITPTCLWPLKSVK